MKLKENKKWRVKDKGDSEKNRMDQGLELCKEKEHHEHLKNKNYLWRQHN